MRSKEKGTQTALQNTAQKKRARRTVRIAVVAVLVALVLGILIWGGPLSVQAETVSAAPFTDSFTENGVVKAGLARKHLSPAAGRVAEVCVQKNSAVHTGDVLVRIEAKDLEYELESHRSALNGCRAKMNEEIRTLRSELNTLIAERNTSVYDKAMDPSPEEYLASLSSKLEVARAEESLALAELESARTLCDLGAESNVSVNEANKAYLEAQSERDELERRLAEADERLTGGNERYYTAIDQSYDAHIQAVREELNAYLALAAAEEPDSGAYEKLALGQQMAEEASRIRELEEKLERCTVRAGCDGYVSELPAETLSDVSEGELIATVRESADFTLEVNVLTNEEPFLRVGDTVALTQKLKGESRSYTGVIREIGSYAEQAVSVTGAEEYRVRVLVDIPESEGLKAGYELEARFTTYHSDSSLSVPNSAVFKSNGQTCVFVASGMRAQLRPVEVSHKASIRSELVSGVSVGEQVVIDANTEGLEDGTLVLASAD